MKFWRNPSERITPALAKKESRHELCPYTRLNRGKHTGKHESNENEQVQEKQEQEQGAERHSEKRKDDRKAEEHPEENKARGTWNTFAVSALPALSNLW